MKSELRSLVRAAHPAKVRKIEVGVKDDRLELDIDLEPNSPRETYQFVTWLEKSGWRFKSMSNVGGHSYICVSEN
jgi:hypothetical protein